MDKIVKRYYLDYMRDDNFRSLPMDIDGLKLVERRVLLACYHVALVKLAKSAKVDGFTIGNYHPHASVYGTIVQMVNQGFLDGQGNFGCNFGIERTNAAASRYTEVKLKKSTKDLCFKYLDFIPWEINDLSEKEPKYLPTMFPICFFGTEYTEGIGSGYRTIIPCYEFEDLKKRLFWLLDGRKEKEEPIIKPISDCEFLSSNEDFKNLLKTGNQKIQVKGKYRKYPSTFSIVINSFPPRKSFENLLNIFEEEFKNNDIGYSDLSSKKLTKITIEVLKQRNKEKIFEKILEKIDLMLTGNIPFQIVVNDFDNGKVGIKSVDEMLLKTYSKFKNINQIMLKKEIEKIDEMIKFLNILELIKPSISHVLGNKMSAEDSILFISKKHKLEKDLIHEILNKYRIYKLLTLNTDTNELEKEKQVFNDNLKDLENFTKQQYIDFKFE